MKIHVAILLGAPLTKQNLARTGAVILSEHFEVIILDCSNWAHPNSTARVENVNWKSIYKVNSINDLKDILAIKKINFAIDFIGDLPIRDQIALALRNEKSYLVIQNLGSIPYKIKPSLRVKEIVNKLIPSIEEKKQMKNQQVRPITTVERKLVPIQGVFYRLKNTLMRPVILRVCNPYTILQIGNRFSSLMSLFALRVIRVASNDYHEFVSSQAEEKENEYSKLEFILFIDDCIIESLDWQLLGIQSPINKEEYFVSLRAFFDQIEKQIGLPVIIAGHPNTNGNVSYDTNFNPREVVYSRTSELAQKASLILVHASTATSFAVLAKKPLFTLTSNCISKTIIGRQIQALSHALGLKTINLDSPPAEITIPIINQRRYQKYTNNYLKGANVQERYQMKNFIDYVSHSIKR